MLPGSHPMAVRAHIRCGGRWFVTPLKRFTLFASIMLCTVGGTAAAESIRSQEINQCRTGDIITWGDGKDHAVSGPPLKFSYNHAGAPDWFSASDVLELANRAAAAWSLCGVNEPVVVAESPGVRQQGYVRILWDSAESRGNFGLANIDKKTLSLGPAPFALLKKRNPNHDGRETLQMLLSHEMGHFFGMMAHSRRCIDVLSYYDNGKGGKCYSREPKQMRLYKEYRSLLPTACDIQRCRIINEKPPLSDRQLL